MISEFIASWALFKFTYLSGWAVGLVLSLLGVVVVARDQIFIGAAISQASTLGIAIGLVFGSYLDEKTHSWAHSELFVSALAVAFSIAAAIITAHKSRQGGESQEAVTGWIFLLSSSLSILIVSKSPHGLEQINGLLSSSIIGATAFDASAFALFFLATAIAFHKYNKEIILLSVDREMASAVGLETGILDAAISVWLGLIIGLAIHIAGTLFTFGCLVLPALVAKNLCREVRWMFLFAPLVALAVNVAGFVAANYYDFPPAQMVVTAMAALVPAAWMVKYARKG